MSRHQLLFFSLFTLFFGCHQAEETPPNIIFLLTDDQRWDALGAMGNAMIQTPEMDQLAAEGVLFENAYVTTPICCTSRASILSGQYARRHKINDFKTHFSADAWQSCYPIQLKKAGYHLGFIGKYGVGAKKDFPINDFDFWRGIPGQPMYEQQDSNGNYVHLTRILGDQCLDFLDSVPQNKSFCLSVSFKAPHVQDADPRQFLFDSTYIDLLADSIIPPARFGENAYFEAFPEFFKTNSEARRRWEMRFSTSDLYQASVKGYYRLIYGVDVVLGRLREALEEKGLAENTVIILMGDNGFFLGERGLAGKWFAYEPSIRVPLIIYDPSLEPAARGQRLPHIALNIDIAPTILDLSGVELPMGMQGESLLPLYQSGTDLPWRTDFLFEHAFEHPGIPKSEGVVSLENKYFRYLSPAPPHEEWYDLTQDPDELENHAQDSIYQEQLLQSRDRLEKLIRINQ